MVVEMDKEVKMMKVSLRFLSILLILLLFTVQGKQSFAHHDVNHVTVDQLIKISDKIYYFAKYNKMEEARLLLEIFALEYEKFDTKEVENSNQVQQTLALSYDNMYTLLQEEAIDQSQVVRAAIEFHLVMDALGSSYQPLWLDKEEEFMNTFATMNQSINEQNEQNFQVSLNELFSLYDLIHPAMLVDLTPGQLKKIDMHIQFLDQYRTTFLQRNDSAAQLAAIQSDFRSLFAGELEEDEADPSLLWVMFSIGSIIFTSLCFVGWKKFRAEKEQVKVHKNRNQ
jgi:sporulation protein YpjB